MIAEAHSRFAIPDHLQFVSEIGDQTAALISTSHGSGKVFLHGATITDFQPTGQDPVLFTSSEAVFDGEKAIRGGIPICFPWFNAHPTEPSLPNHGLVRNREWRLVETGVDSDSTVTLVFEIEVNGFELVYKVKFHEALKVSLMVTNLASEAQSFELALHSYLSVGDIEKIQIDGLGGITYLDNLNDDRRSTLPEGPIKFTEEFDRVFVDSPDEVILRDLVKNRFIRVSKTGASSTVVWNPWIAKAARLSDLGDQDWKRFCCIESGCIADNAVSLAPGNSHTVTLTLAVE